VNSSLHLLLPLHNPLLSSSGFVVTFRQFETGILPWRPGFYPSIGHVGLLVDEVTLGQVLFQLRPVSLASHHCMDVRYSYIIAHEVCDRPDQPARYHNLCPWLGLHIYPRIGSAPANKFTHIHTQLMHLNYCLSHTEPSYCRYSVSTVWFSNPIRGIALFSSMLCVNQSSLFNAWVCWRHFSRDKAAEATSWRLCST